MEVCFDASAFLSENLKKFLPDYVAEEWYCVCSWCAFFVRAFPRTTAVI